MIKYKHITDKNKIAIYGLYCPINKKIMYIGSSGSVMNRFNYHIYNIGINNESKKAWIKLLKDNGNIPELRILEYVEKATRFNREHFWISKYLRKNSLLLNIKNSKIYCTIH